MESGTTTHLTGVMLGTFDPPTKNHAATMYLARCYYPFDQFFMAPFSGNRDKADRATAFKHRLAMCHLAMANSPMVEVLNLDAYGADGGRLTAYRTISQYYVKGTMIALMGADRVPALIEQGQFEPIVSEFAVLVVPRQDAIGTEECQEKLRPFARFQVSHPLQLMYGSGWRFLDVNVDGFSSTKARASLKSGVDTDGLSDAVKAYAARHSLYR
jgi:nicotinic acid mononucleotide adenylyltransferase